MSGSRYLHGTYFHNWKMILSLCGRSSCCLSQPRSAKCHTSLRRWAVVNPSALNLNFGSDLCHHLHMNVLGRDHAANQVEQTAHCATSWHLTFCRQLLNEELGVWPVLRRIQQRPTALLYFWISMSLLKGSLLLMMIDDVTWCFASFDTWQQIHQALNLLLVHLDLCDTVHNLDASFQKTQQLCTALHLQLELLLEKSLDLLQLFILTCHDHIVTGSSKQGTGEIHDVSEFQCHFGTSFWEPASALF